MPIVSEAVVTTADEPIHQGDIFRDVKYSYIDSEDESNVNIIEYQFPMAIIISQACDVAFMDSIITNSAGKPSKFMPSILLCPIYERDVAKSGNHLKTAFDILSLTFNEEVIFVKHDLKIAEKNWHYRLHNLSIKYNGKDVISNAAIDFKHYFTVPITYLIKNKNNRLFRLDDIYAEQVTQKFSNFLSRIATPD